MDVLNVESADDWESVVSGCFVPLRCEGFEARFSGRMEHQRMDDALSVSLVTTSGTSAERTEQLAGNAHSDDIHISLQRSSRGIVVGNGRTAAVGPGSVSVYATDRPYFLDYSWPKQQQHIVQVSRASLGLPAVMLEDAMDRLAVPGGQRSAAVRNLFSYAEGLEDLADRDAAAEVLRDLASAMLRASFDEGGGVPRTSGGLRHAVMEYLREHARDPGIDMDHVARRHFVSRRRLYLVFEEVGLSPAAHLRGERLRIASVLLGESSDITVEQAAYRSGFRDVTTFTRAFARAFGCTPGEWRSTARAAA